MLKTTGSPNEPAPSRNDGSKSASTKNNNSKPVSRKNDGNGKDDGFGVGDDGVEYAKKSEKSKGKKLSKSQKSAKSKKNLSKSRNSSNFGATETGPSFLTPKARAAFNCL